jgi:hypothetical protein
MFLISIYISVYSVGCANTKVTTSIKNPEYTDKAFNNILVFVNIDDLEKRKIIEDTFVEKFATSGINAYSSIKIVPPLKRYTTEELKEILKKNNVDSILIVYVGENNVFVEKGQKTYSTEGYTIISRGGYTYSQQQVREQEGIPIVTSTTKWNVDLYDFVSDKIIWKVQAKTKGIYATLEASPEKIAKSLADEILNKMKEDKILITNSKKKQ